jgi:DNA-binding MarR family transcriptional regulator
MSAKISGLRLTLRLILDTNRLNSSEKLVMMIIAVNSTEQGLCLKMDSQLIADCAGMSRSMISRITQDLEKCGYVLIIDSEKRGKPYKQYSVSEKLYNDYKVLKEETKKIKTFEGYSAPVYTD